MWRERTTPTIPISFIVTSSRIIEQGYHPP
jgi:hypothetical protein